MSADRITFPVVLGRTVTPRPPRGPRRRPPWLLLVLCLLIVVLVVVLV